MNRRRAPGAALLACALTGAVLTVGGSASAAVPTDSSAAAKTPLSSRLAAARGSVDVLLQLKAPSATRSYAAARSKGEAAARDAAASAAAQAAQAVDAAASHLDDAATRGTELYRTTRVFPGLAVRTDAGRLSALAGLPGVVGVLPLTVKQRANTQSDTVTRAVQAWRELGNTGNGVTVGVIDTGIDYDHVDFGGPGRDAYDNNMSTTLDDGGFPTDKVVSGYDFAGDGYNGGNDPKPDPDPLDCRTSRGGGHGTHVAGTVAGFGVTSTGATYRGGYRTITDAQLKSLNIGPGAAPQATLSALRVFGCSGGTLLVAKALDYVAGLNTDDNATNDVDILNLSLGSDFTRGDDPDALAIDALSQTGVLSVIAAGNAGDTYYAVGSPGSARSALTVAATDDGVDTVDGARIETVSGNPPATATATSVIYPATNSVAFPYDTKRGDNSGQLVALTDPANLDGCSTFSAADAAAVKGKYAFLEWDDLGTRRCGSAVRSKNARLAGASGAVFGSNALRFSAGITGDPIIPVTLINKTGADDVRTRLQNGEAVYATFGYGFRAGSAQGARIEDPASIDKIADFTSRGGTPSDGFLKPDVGAPGLHTFSANSGTGNEGLDESGTSMATPHTAGTAALVLAGHPTWTPEQVKADLVNTASAALTTDGQGKGTEYGVTRVGAGRIDGRDAVANDVVASVVGDGGSVGLGFGPVEATGPLTRTKTVRVSNFGRTPQAYTPSYVSAEDVPGVTFEVPAAVTVPAGTPSAPGTATFDVVMRISDVTALRHTVDPTIDAQQVGFPRQYQTEEDGRVLLTPAGPGQVLRLPAAVAPRPASTTRGSDAVVPPSGVARSVGSLDLTGTGIDNGATGAQDTVQSLVGGFQLQVASPRLPACAAGTTEGCVSFEGQRSGDLQYVGASSTVPLGVDDPMVGIGLSTYGRYRTPAYNPTATGIEGEVAFVIYFDTNGDGTDDRETDVTRYAPDTDVLVAETYARNSKGQFAVVVDDQPLNSTFADTDALSSNALIAPVSVAALGLTGGGTRISYRVESYSLDDDGAQLESTAPVTFDVAHPRTLVAPSLDGTLLSRDVPGKLEVRTDTTDTTSPDLGALLLHLHGTEAERAQVVQVRSAAPASPSPSPTATSPNPSPTAASPAPSSPAPGSPAPGSPAPGSPSPSGSPLPPSPSPVVSTSPTTVRPTLSLRPAALVAGQHSTLTVTGLAGSRVDVFGYTRPSTAYRLLRSLTLDSTGHASTVITPLGSTRLYAQQAGGTPGPNVTVAVASAVTERAVRTRRLTYTLTGRVYPGVRGQLVSVYRRAADGSLVLTAQARTRADGVWSVSRRFTSPGAVRLVARSAPTSATNAGQSPQLTVTLR